MPESLEQLIREIASKHYPHYPSDELVEVYIRRIEAARIARGTLPDLDAAVEASVEPWQDEVDFLRSELTRVQADLDEREHKWGDAFSLLQADLALSQSDYDRAKIKRDAALADVSVLKHIVEKYCIPPNA